MIKYNLVGDEPQADPLPILPGDIGGDACSGRMEEGVRQEEGWCVNLSSKNMAESMAIPMISNEITGRKASKLLPIKNARIEAAKKHIAGYLAHLVG
jgi:hypothetical protein